MEINFPLTQLLINGTNCLYVILDAEGSIQFANQLFIKRICNQQNVMDHTSFADTVADDEKARVAKELASVTKLKSLKEFTCAHTILDQATITVKWNIVNSNENGEPRVHCLGVESPLQNETPKVESSDKIQELKTANASLAKRARELASSNEELERFAYVASHDLQEPLRMVSSFLQLLQKRYNEKLDAKANEYIHFAVDGAERMKTLILDLLKFSRVNTSVDEHQLIDINEICESVLLTYKKTIEEKNATVTYNNLPSILGSKTELVQLFQNLVGNALKYCSDKPPVVRIEVLDEENFWQFSVADNGISIDPRFYKKIFVIFQRLHHKNEYSGTGIGLAICKKIIERHGGKIWVESNPGDGSTFYFTLPKYKPEQAKQQLRSSATK